MPGPGGGSRGGGGFGGGGGGFRGGGFGGGGHHGGFHHGPRGPRGPHWGWGWRRPYWGYGGSGCLGILMLPIILLLVAVIMVISVIGGAFGSIAEGGVTEYNEEQFQDFADAQYSQIFGGSTAYEDNILIVLLTTEEADSYYFIAWVGDHISTDVNMLFGNNQTELGRALATSVNQQSYKYSLDSNLADAVGIMAGHIEGLGLSSSFKCQEEHVQVASAMRNYTDLPMTEATVQAALDDFTARTGISIAVVVEDSEEVFSTNYTGMIFGIVIVVILVAVAVFLIVKGIKKGNRKNDPNNTSDGYNGQNNGQYNGYYNGQNDHWRL